MVLSKLDPQKVYSDLANSILLCYEDNNEFCHRHIVSAWIELILNKDVNEVALVNGSVVNVSRPDYIKDILEEIIKKDKNMRGFTSLHALYLFETSESFERKADALEEKGLSGDNYRQAACYLRCDADEAESEYKQRREFIAKR